MEQLYRLIISCVISSIRLVSFRAELPCKVISIGNITTGGQVRPLVRFLAGTC